MKTALAMLFTLLVSESSMAHQAVSREKQTESQEAKDGGGWQIRSRLWWNALALPLYAVAQVTIHEGSHALVGTLFGGRVIDFSPYPHRITQADGQSTFVFGAMYMEGKFTRGQDSLILSAPGLTNLLIFAAADAALAHSPAEAWYGPALFLAGLVFPLADWTANVNDLNRYADASRLAANMGWNRWAVLAAGDAIAAVGVWRVMHHGRRLFIKENERAADRTPVVFGPFSAGAMAGLSVAGQF